MSYKRKESSSKSDSQQGLSGRRAKSDQTSGSQSSSKLKSGVVLDVEISGLDDEGYGISASETHALRIGGALPGDKVRTGIDHVAMRMAFGHVKKILEPSQLRSKRSPCRVSSHCLGCPLIAMKYAAQVEWKRHFIAKHFREYNALDGITVNDMLSPLRLSHYRTTARLVISGKHSEPVIGIFKRSSHQVFNLENCPIHHTLVNRVVEVVRKGISKLRIPIYNPRSKMGLLRYLVVRVSEDEQKVMVVFVTSERSYNEIHHLGKYVREEMPEIEVVAQNVNSSEGNVIMGPSDHFLTAKKHLTEKIGNVRLMLSPRSFFQVNRDGAALIYEKVREWAGLTGQETVLDLYCGIGGISLTLASCAKKVIGVEYVDAAVADAEKNASLNGIANCVFEAGDAADLLEEIAAEYDHIDVAIINPPRKGCDELVLKRLAQLSPDKIIYVSCSPQSLARDLNILKTLGYSTTEVQPVDMFPQTMHVENVVRLEKTEKSA
jgi:23S rRNA (uracil1939-C5)-methyltransferase